MTNLKWIEKRNLEFGFLKEKCNILIEYDFYNLMCWSKMKAKTEPHRIQFHSLIRFTNSIQNHKESSNSMKTSFSTEIPSVAPHGSRRATRLYCCDSSLLPITFPFMTTQPFHPADTV